MSTSTVKKLKEQSYAYCAYLARKDIPTSAPPFKRNYANSVPKIEIGEIYCRIEDYKLPGSLCGKNLKTPEGLRAHIASQHGFSQQHTGHSTSVIAKCEMKKLDGFYQDLMKYDNYEGKPRAPTPEPVIKPEPVSDGDDNFEDLGIPKAMVEQMKDLSGSHQNGDHSNTKASVVERQRAALKKPQKPARPSSNQGGPERGKRRPTEPKGLLSSTWQNDTDRPEKVILSDYLNRGATLNPGITTMVEDAIRTGTAKRSLEDEDDPYTFDIHGEDPPPSPKRARTSTNGQRSGPQPTRKVKPTTVRSHARISRQTRALVEPSTPPPPDDDTKKHLPGGLTGMSPPFAQKTHRQNVNMYSATQGLLASTSPNGVKRSSKQRSQSDEIKVTNSRTATGRIQRKTEHRSTTAQQKAAAARASQRQNRQRTHSKEPKEVSKEERRKFLERMPVLQSRSSTEDRASRARDSEKQTNVSPQQNYSAPSPAQQPNSNNSGEPQELQELAAQKALHEINLKQAQLQTSLLQHQQTASNIKAELQQTIIDETQKRQELLQTKQALLILQREIQETQQREMAQRAELQEIQLEGAVVGKALDEARVKEVDVEGQLVDVGEQERVAREKLRAVKKQGRAMVIDLGDDEGEEG